MGLQHRLWGDGGRGHDWGAKHRAGPPAGRCHHCPCGMSLTFGPREHLSTEGHLCMSLPATMSPVGKPLCGHGSSSLPCWSSLPCTFPRAPAHVHACTRKFQTSHHSTSTVTCPNLHCWLGVEVWSKSDIETGLSLLSPFTKKGLSNQHYGCLLDGPHRPPWLVRSAP